ncbi:hypothetical protein D3C76_1394250 [compost metagenome]
MAHLAADAQAVLAGQHQVEDHQVRLLGNDPRRRPGAIALHFHGKAIGLQVFTGQVGQPLVILDDQYPTALLHGSPQQLVVIKSAHFTKRQHWPRILRRAPAPANRRCKRLKTCGKAARTSRFFVIGFAPAKSACGLKTCEKIGDSRSCRAKTRPTRG